MFCKCPICGAGPVLRVTDRMCLCGWTERQASAVERLTRERDEARESLAEAHEAKDILQEILERTERERDRFRALLVDLEWASTSNNGADQCPACGNERSEGVGHSTTCRLAAALKGRDGVHL